MLAINRLNILALPNGDLIQYVHFTDVVTEAQSTSQIKPRLAELGTNRTQSSFGGKPKLASFSISSTDS